MSFGKRCPMLLPQARDISYGNEPGTRKHWKWQFNKYRHMTQSIIKIWHRADTVHVTLYHNLYEGNHHQRLENTVDSVYRIHVN
jgi:hypothetical protein